MKSDRRYVLGAGTARLTEPQHMRQIRDIADAAGFEHEYHTEFSIRSSARSRGYPDLCLVKEGGRTIYFEVKGSIQSRIETRQVEWVRALRSTGIHAYIVYPKDLDLVVGIIYGDFEEPERGSGWVPGELRSILENEPEPTPYLKGEIETDGSGRVRWRSGHTA